MTVLIPVLFAAASSAAPDLPELVSDEALMFFASYSNLVDEVDDQNTWDGHTNDVLRWYSKTASGFLANMSAECEREVFFNVFDHFWERKRNARGEEQLYRIDSNFLHRVSTESQFLDSIKSTNAAYYCNAGTKFADDSFGQIRRPSTLEEGAVASNVFCRIRKSLLYTSESFRQRFDDTFMSNGSQYTGAGSTQFFFVSTNAPTNFEDTRFPEFDWTRDVLSVIPSNEWPYVWPQFSQFPTNGIVPIEPKDTYRIPGFGDYEFGNPAGKYLIDFLNDFGTDFSDGNYWGDKLAKRHVRLWNDESMTNRFAGTSISNTVHYGHPTERLDYTRQALEAQVYHMLDRRYLRLMLHPQVSNVISVARHEIANDGDIVLRIGSDVRDPAPGIHPWRLRCRILDPIPVSEFRTTDEIVPFSTNGSSKVFCEIGSADVKVSANARSGDTPFIVRYEDLASLMKEGDICGFQLATFMPSAAGGVVYSTVRYLRNGNDYDTFDVVYYAEITNSVNFNLSISSSSTFTETLNCEGYNPLDDYGIYLDTFNSEVRWPFTLGRIHNAIFSFVEKNTFDVEQITESDWPKYRCENLDVSDASFAENYARSFVGDSCDNVVESLKEKVPSYPKQEVNLDCLLENTIDKFEYVYCDPSTCYMPPHSLRKTGDTIEIFSGSGWDPVPRSDYFKIGELHIAFGDSLNYTTGMPVRVDADLFCGADIRYKFKNLRGKDED